MQLVSHTGLTQLPDDVSAYGSRSRRRASSTGTIERGLMRARSRSALSHRSCSASISTARMPGLTWPYTPCMPGISWPIRSFSVPRGCRPRPSRSVVRAEGRGVRLRRTGSHDATDASSAGGCPVPGQRTRPSLTCAISVPSMRRGHARPHTRQRPVCWSFTRRASPQPVGGVKSSPIMAGGHGGTGRPGNNSHLVTRTGTAGRVFLPFRGKYQPSAAGRKTSRCN